MSVRALSRLAAAVRSAGTRARRMLRRQFITRNRRLAAGLAVATVVIGVAAAKVSTDLYLPGLLVLPILAGGLELRPRALRILFVIVAGMLCYDWVAAGKAGPGLAATLAVTALFAELLARSRKKLGLQGLRGDQMLIDLRDQIRSRSTLPELPTGWHSAAVLRPAGGSSFGGDFLVSVCDRKTLEVALVDVAGKGIDAGTRSLLLSGAFGGLLGSVRSGEFLGACNAYLRRSAPDGFVTAVHLVLDLVTGDYVVSSAGHPPAAHFEVGSGQWRLLGATGIVLGAVADPRLSPDSGTLRTGDALMLYTDGLIEAPGRDLDAGIDRLLGEADRLVASGFDGAGELVQRIQANQRSGDDCAMVLVWRT